MAQQSAGKENYLLTVLSVAFVLGIAVAIAVYVAWSRGVLAAPGQGLSSVIGLLFCPPFILTVAVGPTAEPDLASVLVVGAIIFANACLYAGVAAGGYYVVELMVRRRKG